jgi:hypothetical protein
MILLLICEDVDLRVGVRHDAAPTELIAIFIVGAIEILLLRSTRYMIGSSNRRAPKQKVAPVREALLDLKNVQTAERCPRSSMPFEAVKMGC